MRLPLAAPDGRGSGCRVPRAVRGHPARRAQRQVRRARRARRTTPRSRTASRTDCRSTPAPRVRGSASRCSRRSRPRRRGTGPRPTVSVTVERRRRDRARAGGVRARARDRPVGPRARRSPLLPSGGFVLLDTTTHARARGRGPRARCHPRRAGHAQGGRLRRQRPHPAAAAVQSSHEDAAAVASAFEVGRRRGRDARARARRARDGRRRAHPGRPAAEVWHSIVFGAGPSMSAYVRGGDLRQSRRLSLSR